MRAFSLHLSKHIWRLQCRRSQKKIEERFRIYLFRQLICILSPSVAVAGPYEYTGLYKYILQTSGIVFARPCEEGDLQAYREVAKNRPESDG